jgi:predicted aconitase with swiveling domain
LVLVVLSVDHDQCHRAFNAVLNITTCPAFKIPISDAVASLAAAASSALSASAGGNMRIVYSRVPITDEQTPSVDVFDWFARHVESAADGRFLLFNCQMGRGRTTTAMVIAALVTLQRPHSAVAFEDVERMLRAAAAGGGGVIGGAGYAPPVPVAVQLPTSAQTKSATEGAATATAAVITPEQTAAYERGIGC